jgi:co-chaperonin GroES (HSP10)
MKMLRNNILVKPLPKKQIGKIVKPSSVKEDWYRGEVILVGPLVGLTRPANCLTLGQEEKQPEDDGIKVGDIVIFPPSMRGSWPKVDYEGEEMNIINEIDVWAIE